VVLSADPALTLRITYTLQHAIPSRTLRLPRPGLSASAFQQATRIAANIFLEAQDAAEWNCRQDLVLDRCLRTFFADVPSTDLYDPTGSARRAPHILYGRLHDYLTEHMEREDGIRVHIDHLEVLVHPQQATHARADLRRVA
jgi:hypothetical protein